MKLHAAIALIVAAAVGGLVFVFVQIGGSSSGVGARTASACTERAPECMPRLAMTDREGIEWTPVDFDNKVVVINVWATWCAPCKHELPELVELRRHYGDQDLLLLGILTDEPGEAKVSGFVGAYNINYPIIPLTGAIDEAFASPSRLPTTFVYDRSGHLAHQKTGAVTMAGLRQVIDKLL
jgi:thiol-disulfide isomerase/thioredoxin